MNGRKGSDEVNEADEDDYCFERETVNRINMFSALQYSTHWMHKQLFTCASTITIIIILLGLFTNSCAAQEQATLNV